MALFQNQAVCQKGMIIYMTSWYLPYITHERLNTGLHYDRWMPLSKHILIICINILFTINFGVIWTLILYSFPQKEVVRYTSPGTNRSPVPECSQFIHNAYQIWSVLTVVYPDIELCRV
jgi:hypothetical protein